MTTTRPGTAEEPTALRCSDCDEPIAECELCDERECPRAICYRCITLALSETMARWARRWRSRTRTAGEDARVTRSRIEE